MTRDRLRSRIFECRSLGLAHCGFFLLAVIANTGVAQVEERYDELLATAEAAGIGALGGVHLSATAASLFGDPITSFAGESLALSSNLALKLLEAPLLAPPDRTFYPNADGNCRREFSLPQSLTLFSNLFGLVSVSGAFTPGANPITGVPDDWGELGTPAVYHASTEVLLTANNPYIELSGNEQTVSFPAGTHTIHWTADTILDPVFDELLPAAMLAYSGYSKLRKGEFAAALAGNADDAAKAAKTTKSAGEWLAEKLKLAAKACGSTAGEAAKKCVLPVLKEVAMYYADEVTAFEEVSRSRTRDQTFTVYDVHPPSLDITEPVLSLEAADFGGTFLERVRDQIFSTVVADDECDRPVTLANDLPTLLPLGDTTVTWTVSDLGPNPEGGVYSVTKTQTIRVNDTQPPIIVPPPGRVIEVDPNDSDASDGSYASGVDPDLVDLGVPLVVDLADSMPTISSDAPDFFPVNTRTEVIWSATDHGFPNPNTSSAAQLITVKELGTNTAPLVEDRSVTTLTSAPIDIVLTGIDNDFLDDRADPIAFSIVDRPDNGEFIAPLLPYFIEDYRTNPGGPYGEEFYLSGNRTKWMYDNVCRDPNLSGDQKIRRDWVYAPRFVHVTDDGTVFMIDTYWRCNPSDATGGGPRISKWDREGNYLGQIDYNGTTDAFVMDQDGFIYTLTKQGAGSSTTLTLTQIRPNFDQDPTNARGDAWRFDFASTGNDPVSNEQFSYARVDSERGLIYVNDRRRVFVYDVRNDLADGEDRFVNGMEDQYLGALNNGEVVIGCTSFGSSWSGFAMEVDSEGYLYVADTCADRIHRFEPSGFDEEGNFVPGRYIGWMGRCDASTNKACDEKEGTTKGYSCSDQTCTTTESDGSDAGQFSTPVYLALDPNDILYVADYANSRIQRFAPDGSFAGEAASTGTGINRGDHPSFVLGNMAPPKSVTVNSTQFFVVDTAESFVHVFETTPFKDITDDSATVTYVSNFDFHGATDRFVYRASDGLAESDTAAVSVRVNRNFRPPVVQALALGTEEDRDLDIELVGDDPDGIIGVDFNGLDRLSFRVESDPANGTLQGTPPSLTYIPNPDFAGEDRFTYVANDGVYDSEPAEVIIEVVPVDDPVRVTDMKLPDLAGRGYPIVFEGTYFDDGGTSVHNAYVFWGDIEEVNGDFVDPDGDGETPPELQGLKVIQPTNFDGEGKVLGQHVYAQAGDQTVFFCMSDENEQDCAQRDIEVREVVNLGIDMEVESNETSAEFIDIELTAMNSLPAGYDGLEADNIHVEQLSFDGIEVVSADHLAGTSTNCAIDGGAIACDADRFAPGESTTILLRVQPENPAVFTPVEGPFSIGISTSSDALQETYEATLWLRFDVDTTDDDADGMSNRYETLYGLNVSGNDAEEDFDADGLNNLEEFARRTLPNEADTDGDGLSDGLEVELFTDPLQFTENPPRIYSGSEKEVINAYIAFYGRPADPGGLNFWAGELERLNGDLSGIIEAFGNSQEFIDRYGNFSDEQLIDNIYQQLFNRDPDPAGKEFFLNLLRSGEKSLQSIALDVLNGAQGEDLDIVLAKLAVAQYFTSSLESNSFEYAGADAANLAKTLLDGVSDAEAGKRLVDDFFAEQGQTSAALATIGGEGAGPTHSSLIQTDAQIYRLTRDPRLSDESALRLRLSVPIDSSTELTIWDAQGAKILAKLAAGESVTGYLMPSAVVTVGSGVSSNPSTDVLSSDGARTTEIELSYPQRLYFPHESNGYSRVDSDIDSYRADDSALAGFHAPAILIQGIAQESDELGPHFSLFTSAISTTAPLAPDTGFALWGDASSNAHPTPRPQYPGQDADFTSATPPSIRAVDRGSECFELGDTGKRLFIPSAPTPIAAPCSEPYAEDLGALRAQAEAACGNYHWELPSALEFKSLFDFDEQPQQSLSRLLRGAAPARVTGAYPSGPDLGYRTRDCSVSGNPNAGFALTPDGRIFLSDTPELPGLLVGSPNR